MRKELLNPEHPELATALDALGALYLAEGKYDLADPLLNRATEIRERRLRPGHPDLATSLENYAALLQKTGRGAQASELERRAREIRLTKSE